MDRQFLGVKMRGNAGPKSEKLERGAGLGADKIWLNFIRKRDVFGNLRGGPHAAAQTSKNERK